jgi:hypothetical protein
MTDEYTGDIPRLKIRHALLPITAVACFLLGLATTLREPAPTLALDEVVAMKPVEGEENPPAFTKMPIEALYGVPSERTKHLWPHFEPQSSNK